MKKSLLALAVLGAFAGAAQAQSSVTIYGIVDAGVRHQTNTNADGDSTTSMVQGHQSTNRLGFKGVEDLGGGMHARFTLESGFATDTGMLDNTTNRLFNRTATVGIGGAWGGIDLGRQYSVSFKTIGAYDPFSYRYISIIPLAGAAAGTVSATTATLGGTRYDNDLQYTGTFGPVTVRAEYAFGEQAGSTGDGSAQAIGATYAAGPLTIGGAYTREKNDLNGAVPDGFENANQWTIGGAYVVGPVRVAAGYIVDTQELGAGIDDTKIKNSWIGASYSVTPALSLTGGYYQTKLETVLGAGDGKRKLFIVGANYALSKRTALYAEIDRISLKDGMRPSVKQDNQTGMSVGITHSF